ncbi:MULTISPECIES: TIGR04255 family protein [unclassified Imperialibacter]|uniref:TIGR04255 family protein n=1 Tax=unclassified Imperialibacter TaxID=2629706 RepID=UPI0012583451|nr:MULTISPECIES: TIGR04255 family protein [unclassified Imperialibacter]CAD5270668.1 conserved hypothetical protein [Imperialibacter sp. 89]CAD5298356.1 conserved hypothetical protein [Imperialibacter sp. 75]VVT34879.1 conserved hypothetical protein [Imperialibacter sp. EC-SDR9]
MSLKNVIRPISGHHSIREAVISLFLVNPILNVSRFEELIKEAFKDYFQKFDKINTIEFEVRHEKGVLSQKPALVEDAGFKFSRFDEGKTTAIFQGQNEMNRTLVSFHNLDYLRWGDFIKDYFFILDNIKTYLNENQVSAIGLHYVDQFLWISKEPIDVSLLFKPNGPYLPKEFFESQNANFILTTEKTIGNDNFTNRLQVKTESKVSPSITISHNLIRRLNKSSDLNSLTAEEGLKNVINAAHEQNKSLLAQLLKDDVKELISLK